MDRRDDELQLAIYRPPPRFTGGFLEIRLFYVRITPCSVDGLPNQLRLRHLRRELGVLLEINGARIPPADAVCINLRRDRVDKDSSEVTYVSTDGVRVSGPIEFEVCEEGDDGDLILSGSLERADVGPAWGDENVSGNDSRSGWSLECYVANSVGRSALLHTNKKACSPSIEVYIAGCCSMVPVILMKTILISPRRKVRQGVALDAIPEHEEMGKEKTNLCNGVVRQRKLQFVPADMDDYDSDGKISHGNYSEEMYPGEDGQLSFQFRCKGRCRNRSWNVPWRRNRRWPAHAIISSHDQEFQAKVFLISTLFEKMMKKKKIQVVVAIMVEMKSMPLLGYC